MALVTSCFADDDDDDERRIMELLLGSGPISEEQVAQACAVRKSACGALTKIVVDLNFATEQLDAMTRAQVHKLQCFDFAGCQVDPKALRLIPEQVAGRYGVLPVMIADGKVIFTASEPATVGLGFTEISECLRRREIASVALLASKTDPGAAISRAFGPDLAAPDIKTMSSLRIPLFQCTFETARSPERPALSLFGVIR